MARAIELVRRGMALAHPNPRVGAVIVKNGRKVGEGFHVYDRLDHAEIVALRAAGREARGASMYVSLEPCSTTGRTGPCTEAIIAAGVKQVYAAMRDPNPRVAGRGLARLKRAGIEVKLSENHEAHAREINEDFAKWIRSGLPFVTLKTALTLDGQIAARAGSTTWITSEDSRSEVQRMRHAADAVVTGIGTVLTDDPRMSDRTGEPRRRRLLRVVLDSRLRLPLKTQLVESAEGDVLVFTTQRDDSARAGALKRAGIEVVSVRGRRGHVDLHAVVEQLGKREILSVLLEAGPELNGAALEADLVDKMVLFYAPKIMGTRGVPMARVSSRWFAKSRALTNLVVHRYGQDFAVQGYFHDVYGNHGTHRKN
jgi:diaminohydroxyphosphoribosylaminopyrimidine deaminase/5-amino-6-(5-phosphoribosylamino)uracil reductase